MLPIVFMATMTQDTTCWNKEEIIYALHNIVTIYYELLSTRTCPCQIIKLQSVIDKFSQFLEFGALHEIILKICKNWIFEKLNIGLNKRVIFPPKKFTMKTHDTLLYNNFHKLF